MPRTDGKKFYTDDKGKERECTPEESEEVIQQWQQWEEEGTKDVKSNKKRKP